MKRKIHSKRGDILLQSVGIFLILCVAAAILFEFARVFIVKRGVREMVTQAVTAGSAHNLYNSYDGVREENSATWDKAQKAGAWTEMVDKEDVVARMKHLFAMTQEGATLHKMSGAKLEFSLEAMAIEAQNPTVGSRGKAEITYEITYDLLLPWGLEALPPMRFPMRQESIYRPKF